MTLSIRSLILLFVGVLIATVSAGTNQEGLDFLAKKATEEGVVKLDSGLMYKGKRKQQRWAA
jgi:Domain amino terminal to FKBP-type peptidyl-prolyl isomerase